MPSDAQGPISAALGKDDSSYWIHRTGAGLRGENPQNAVTADFTKQGAEIRTHDLRWRLEMRGYGYGDALHRLRAVAPHSEVNRVEYRRNSLTEWYENGPLGLEQGFTLAHPPGEAHGRPLALELALQGNVVASLDAGGKELELKPKYGEGKLVYTGLKARDAPGRELRSWLELRGERLLVRVEDAGARYPVVVDPWIELPDLAASDGANGDYFGLSVAVSGKIVVVGAPYHTVGKNTKQGAAYVFVESGGKWSQKAELTADDGVAGDDFGMAVAVSGTTAVVGSSVHPYSSKSLGAGAAYVFVESDEKWPQTAKLTANNGMEGDAFGASVAISGGTAVIGAPQHPYMSKSPGQGAAYVFAGSGANWPQQMELDPASASEPKPNDRFGFSVGISGSTAVVGAPQHPYNSGTSTEGPGAAYVFGKSGVKWIQQTVLGAPDGANGDRFGRSVAISGSTVIAGAPQHTVGMNNKQGASYVFTKSGKTWNLTPKELTAPDGAAGDYFGVSVAISGKTAMAGAEYHKVAGKQDQGEAYIFSESGETWGPPEELTADDGVAYDYFGYSVAISGSTP
ncbi:MAG: FG-GAP repeat protein, partial [Mycobacterium sp.]